MAQRTVTFTLGGGLDLVTPASSMPPGRLIGCLNYEPDDQGGYRRIQGYERFDGRPSPSDADYWRLPFTNGSTEPAVGSTITGATSSATMDILHAVVETGSWATGDAAGHFIGCDATGTFAASESITGATVTGPALRNRENDQALHEQYQREAIERRRSKIGMVPGSGPIRGVWVYKKTGLVYAVRDSADGTAGVMHRSSATGWQPVDLGSRIAFTAGTAEFIEGETITGQTSGATATVVATGVDSGSFTGGDAAGSIYLTGITGTFQAGETITSASGSATAGAVSANTLPPGGHYEFHEYNFQGQLKTRYLFGVNGVGRAFRFDGTDFAFIHVTGMTEADDKPTHAKAHKHHLFVSIGSSLFNSSVGDPMKWDAVEGAGEIATGDRIVGIDTQAGGVLAVYNRNSTYLLYGNDVNDFTLTPYSSERGAIEWSLQNVMVPIYMDDRGLNYLNPTQAFGDFNAQTISEVINPIVQAEKEYVLSSVRIRAKNQYRLHFEDNSALLATITPSLKIQYMLINYGKRVLTICAEEDASGTEQVFFGSDDGYVYHAEKGNSFDGENIDYYLRMSYYDCGLPRVNKRFHKASYLIESTLTPVLRYIPDFSYGSAELPAVKEYSLPPEDIHSGGGYWGESYWGEFIWGGQPVGEAEAYIDGHGFNLSMMIRGESNFEDVHTLKSATFHFTPRGLQR